MENISITATAIVRFVFKYISIDCNPECKTCTANSLTKCLSCHPGYELKIYSETNKQCKKIIGIYIYIYIECNPSCKTCTSTNVCSSCHSGKKLTSDNQCIGKIYLYIYIYIHHIYIYIYIVDCQEGEYQSGNECKSKIRLLPNYIYRMCRNMQKLLWWLKYSVFLL